jgi:hypothetical protein
MNWTYLDAPIVCEECEKVLEEHSGYTSTQYGICDDCLARVQQSNTGLQADGAKAPEHTGTPYTCEHPDCKKWWGDRPAAKA